MAVIQATLVSCGIFFSARQPVSLGLYYLPIIEAGVGVDAGDGGTMPLAALLGGDGVAAPLCGVPAQDT